MPSGVAAPCCAPRPRSSVPLKQPNGAKWTYLGYLYRARWAVLVLSFVILTILGVYALGAFHSFSDGGFHNPHGDATRTAVGLVRNFVFPDPDVAVLLESPVYKVDDPEFQNVAREVKAAFAKLPTFGYISWFDFPTLTSLVSDDRHKALMYFKVKERLSNTKLNGAVPSPLPASTFTVTVGGHIVTLNSLTDQVLQDLARAEVSSLPVLIILMLFTFGGVVAMICPLLVALHTIVWSLALLRGLGTEWHISNYAIEVVTMMGLGLSIDYSLFIVSRFMSERRVRPRPEDVLVVMDRVMSTSGRTIQFSAVTVMLSLTGAFVFSEYFVGSLALAIMSVAASACVVCSVILPALLFILDRHIFRLSTSWLCDTIFGYCCKSSQSAEESTLRKEHGFWYRIAHFTMRRPIPILFTAVSAFVALSAVFFTQVKFGYTDANTLPIMSPARVVNHAENTYFSKLGTAQLDVYLQTADKQGVRSAGFIKELDVFATKAATLPGVRDVVCQVRRVGEASYTLDDYVKLYENPLAPAPHLAITSKLYEPLFITDLDRVSRVQVQLRDGPYSPRSRRTVKQLRALLVSSFPETRMSDRGITSTPAFFSDLMDDIAKSIPVWACVMVTVVFVLVLLMTASPFLAVKAVLTGVLSLGGAFGIILILFQMGEGKTNVLNMVPCGYLDGLQLVFIFTVAFGLGVDYELFVLSSIQEWYHRLGDHREAIAEGLNRAGRSVSQAALLLAIVTGSFVLSSVGLIKMIGFGIAISVLLDATVVRSCLVPTVLILAGEKVVWWSPAWLRRLRDRLGLTERELDDSDLMDRTGGTSTPLEAVIVTEAEAKDPSRV